MKNKNTSMVNAAGSTIQNLASLPGHAIDSKKAKESKIVQFRAIVFDRQMINNFEIIF